MNPIITTGKFQPKFTENETLCDRQIPPVIAETRQKEIKNMNYAISDIHGQYKKYMAMLEKISFSDDDHLYIIGDAIDRGPDGGKVLLDIMDRKNVTLLMGNHESMMLYSGQNRGMLDTWTLNGGVVTARQLSELGYNLGDFTAFLESLPVVIPNLEVNGKKFCLVHACPPVRNIRKTMYEDDLTPGELYDCVWSRRLAMRQEGMKTIDLMAAYADTTILMGHTPVTDCGYGLSDADGLPLISPNAGGRVLNLDCGCSKISVDPEGIRLGCLRLEDMEEFYV